MPERSRVPCLLQCLYLALRGIARASDAIWRSGVLPASHPFCYGLVSLATLYSSGRSLCQLTQSLAPMSLFAATLVYPSSNLEGGCGTLVITTLPVVLCFFFLCQILTLRCRGQIHISQIAERQKTKFSEDFAFLGRPLGGIPYCVPACGVVCSRRKVPNIRRSVLHPSSGQINSTRLHNARTQTTVSVKRSVLKLATLRAVLVHGVELECENCNYFNTYSIERTKQNKLHHVPQCNTSKQISTSVS